MYLRNVKLWNFRKYGSDGSFDLRSPNLSLTLNDGVNLFIGENDSGKTAVIDAIKLVLKTHSIDWITTGEEDFYKDKDRLRVELEFSGFFDDEAKNFTEWLGFEEASGGDKVPFLKISLDVRRNPSGRILHSDVRAGVDDEGKPLDFEAREYLRATYLKPLRDASNELIPRRNSRLSQILLGHDAFKGPERSHYLYGLFDEFNQSVERYFEGRDRAGNPLVQDERGKALKETIDGFIKKFISAEKNSSFSVLEGHIKNILERLELSIQNEINPGLGTLNRLFIAAELLHLQKPGWTGLRLGLIEEVEAHLHPQAQMQVVEGLTNETGIQLILTTHSPNIGSKVDLKRIFIFKESNVFPMGPGNTQLLPKQYIFLERFLDVTKANLFFAKGVILVEGWAEEILLPAIASKLEINLTAKGISVVNIGSIAFLHYVNIFKRSKAPDFEVPVSIITDVDIRPDMDAKDKSLIPRKTQEIQRKYDGQSVKTFVAPIWTLEYCLMKSSTFGAAFKSAACTVHKGLKKGDFEKKVVSMLRNKTFKKVSVASIMADAIDNDPSLIIQPKDVHIEYLLNALTYASDN